MGSAAPALTMGASAGRGRNADDANAVDEELASGHQRSFIDAAGNIRASARQGSRLPGSIELRGRETEASYHGMSEGEQPEQPGEWWHLRTCFPRFRWRSVLGVAVALQLLTYVASCWLVTPRKAFEPHPTALWKIGSSNWMAERCATAVRGKFVIELRRLIVPIFLHGGVMHILLNLYFEFVSGQRAMEKYGPGPFLLLFLASGVCGNLLSDAFETNGVGASTSCYGLIGADFAQVWLVWNLPDREEWRAHMRTALSQQAGMLVLWEVLNWSTIDHFGHLGGLLSGFALGVLLAKPGDDTNEPLPSNLRRRALLCGVALTLGIVACAFKIFLWGSQEVVALPATNGKIMDFKWKDVCEQEWANYAA